MTSTQPILAVTTSYDPKPHHVARAKAVALRSGAPYLVRRRGLDSMFRPGEVELIYVVSKRRDELRSPNQHIFVHEGMMKLKSQPGKDHPLCRAVAPDGAPPVARVVDATMGLAGDAIQLAIVLGLEVEGIEASPVICALLEEGFQRLARETPLKWRDAFTRLSVTEGRALDVLRTMPGGSRPVVYFDPMFATPLGAAPGFDVFRRVAEHAPLDEATLLEAIRVASDRVVVKVAHGERATAEVQPGYNRRVCGIAFDYLIVEKALPHPQWEHRRLPTGHY
jgi:hypothetical protein